MSECTHDCETCSENCESRAPAKEPCNSYSKIKKVIGIVSGKGGVGKSTVTAMLAVLMNRRGYRVGILDADITGPSIPKAFGLKENCQANELGIFPAESKTGIKAVSINLLLDDPAKPVVWRGPVLAGAVKQFWTDVVWEDVDFLFVDMPPGTGDVPLTVFQSLPVDGIVVVTSPQSLVGMIVEKAVRMAGMMNVPVLGLVENYSYLKCPDCGREISVFGESQAEETAKAEGLELLARMPIDPAIASLCDKGLIELFEGDALERAADRVEALIKSKQ